MKISIEYEDKDYAAMASRKSKDTVKHLFHLSSTLEVINFFGLQKYPYDERINHISNTLLDCLYLIETHIPDKK